MTQIVRAPSSSDGGQHSGVSPVTVRRPRIAPARFDLVGLGLNATDHIYRIPELPGAGGKIAFESESLRPGGQVAVACVVCRRYGHAVSYAGTIGDDAAGEYQRGELEREGVEISHLRVVAGETSQQAWIMVEPGGERTIYYHRPAGLVVTAESVDAGWVASGRLLHVDGHDAAAAARAAEYARLAGVIVTADLSNVYPAQIEHTEALLRHTDFLMGSRDFATRMTRVGETGAALAALRSRYGVPVVGATLGGEGVLVLADEGELRIEGFDVPAVDTTGAGDVFHGAFIVGLLRGWALRDALEFACALAALNCTAEGARGYIATEAEVCSLIARGRRR
jgi:sulfofructose kinase